MECVDLFLLAEAALCILMAKELTREAEQYRTDAANEAQRLKGLDARIARQQTRLNQLIQGEL